MKKKNLVIMICLILVVGAVAAGVYVYKNNSNIESLDGIVVDIDEDSDLIVYTEDFGSRYQILQIKMTKETEISLEKIEINQNIHITYDEPFVDIGPAYLYAKKITVNKDPDEDYVKKANDFYYDFCKRTGFREI